MLKAIADVSTELLGFIEARPLSLSKPQKQHVAQVADALITTDVWFGTNPRGGV